MSGETGEPRYGPAISAPHDQDTLMVANSTLMGFSPLARDSYFGTTILVTNNFVDDPQWLSFPEEEGNFSAWPDFLLPGPPTTYFLSDWDWTSVDRGTDVGLPYTGMAPDVGAFETRTDYTPQAPTGLTAAYDNPGRGTRLGWTPSANDGHPGPAEVFAYDIFRSTDPDYLPQEWETPYATVPAGVTHYEDPDVTFDTAYTYYVVAAGAYFSGPSQAASATPTNLPPSTQDDAIIVDANSSTAVLLLANDTDGDLHALAITSVTTPSHGNAAVLGEGITYTPAVSWFGTDTFYYTVSDGFGGVSTAAVTVEVLPVGPVMGVDKLRVDWKKTYMRATGTI